MTKHTPTPWAYGVYEITDNMRKRLERPQSCVCLPDTADSPRMVIALCGDAMDENSRADSEFIARAVNSHEELLEAAKAVMELAVSEGIGFKHQAMRDFRNAIAKAEKGE